MGRFAKGKRSRAISDRSGFEVPYTQLKTTWNNLRVEPEEFEVKHPRLTPPKNIIDPTALFDPRPNNDPENVSIFFNFNWFNNAPTGMQATQYKKPNLPVGKGSVGFVTFEILELPTGIAGTGAIGTETLELTITESGVAGTGNIGSPEPTIEISGVSGSSGVGAVGVEALSLSILESGVAGTSAVGTETPEASITESGVSATGAIGNEGFESSITETGLAGTGAVGTEVPEASITESGVAGTGATGTESVETNREWGAGAWNTGTWGE
jgi:hypothetical protein